MMESLPLNLRQTSYTSLNNGGSAQAASQHVVRRRKVGMVALIVCVGLSTVYVAKYHRLDGTGNDGSGPNKGQNGGLKGPLFKEDLASIPFVQKEHPFKPSSIWGNIEKPYPTGAWWLNLALEGSTVCAVPQPYGARLSSTNGMIISNPPSYRVVSPKAIQDGCGQDLIVGSTADRANPTIDRYDALSVTVRFDEEGEEEEEESANSGGVFTPPASGGGSFRTHLVAGSPFVATEYADGAVPKVTSAVGGFVSVNGSAAPGTFRGRYLTAVLPTGITWGLYAVEDELELAWDGASMLIATNENTFTGALLVAACPQPRACDVLAERYASTYAVGGEVELEAPGTVRYRWATAGGGGGGDGTTGGGTLLMLAAPHHMDLLEAPALARGLPAGAFLSMKGPLTGVEGPAWEMVDRAPANATWGAAAPPANGTGGVDPAWAQAMLAQLQEDAQISMTMAAPDPYGCGKELGRTARLALIAEELEQHDLALQLAQAVEARLAEWLADGNADNLVYDPVWGGVVSANGLADSAADYGNGWYNDHHFQYGYFVYAAAAVQHLDPTFAARRGAHFDFLVADIAGGANNTLLPAARHKDFWAFHSWADGLFAQGDGKNEESSTEAINAYYGVALWGQATNNTALADWGRLLLTMELRAVQRYWHMTDDSVYDAVFAANRMVGNVGSLDAVDSTWFGDSHVFVHGINMMPFTPVTGQVLTCDFVALEYPALEGFLPGAADPWRAFAYLAHAVLDPQKAWDEFAAVQQLDDGLTRTAGMYWIATRPPCTPSVSATAKRAAAVVAAACAANSACVGAGLSAGDCCPTPAGAFLGCCPRQVTYPSLAGPSGGSCSLNEKCAVVGLQGDCCPTQEGVYLGCCSILEANSTTATVAPTAQAGPPGGGSGESSSTPSSGGSNSGGSGSEQCSAHTACAAAGLVGDCCPAPGGADLACCAETQGQGGSGQQGGGGGVGGGAPAAPAPAPAPAPSPTPPSSSASSSDNDDGGKADSNCAAHGACTALGLTGACCPSEDGVLLECCGST